MPCPRSATGPTRSTPGDSRAWSNSRTFRFHMTASGRRARTSPSPRCPARPSLWSVRRAPASRRPSRCCIARSIADNLRVGKPDATEEEMRIAAARAQALEFIERGERGFETSAGERGRMLSGGERQRLSIARALLKDPPILILDEATSALDAVTEAKVNAALDEVMKGRTTFVIAHRLSTIRNATRILVFDAGRVIESGTFDELVAQGGRFAELARAQFMVQENSRASLAAPEANTAAVKI